MPAQTFGGQEPRARRTRDGLRVVRVAVATAGLQRGINLSAVLARGAGVTSASMAVALAASATWGCLLLWDGWRRGGFRSGLAALDVMFAVAVGLLALTWGSPGMRFGYGVLQGAALVAGFALSVRAVAVAVSALVFVNFLAALAPAGSGGIAVTEFLAYAGTLVVLALGAAAARRLLCSAADAVDRRRADPGGTAGKQAEQQRVLHDTALATLTAIATGVLDVRADEVRARCARDAAFLRLVMQGGQVSPGSLAVALAAAAEEAAAVGLRVHPMCDALPRGLDRAVVMAIAMAVREALNNVHRHAGTGEAWLTAAEEGGRVVVRVIDRGPGFPAADALAGGGIRDSICARMREAGGAALVESAPGQGTCVELRWPR
jgi:signal transduction histidine kinase